MYTFHCSRWQVLFIWYSSWCADIHIDVLPTDFDIHIDVLPTDFDIHIDVLPTDFDIHIDVLPTDFGSTGNKTDPACMMNWQQEQNLVLSTARKEHSPPPTHFAPYNHHGWMGVKNQLTVCPQPILLHFPCSTFSQILWHSLVEELVSPLSSQVKVYRMLTKSVLPWSWMTGH